MKKLASLLLAVCFTCVTVGPALAQQAMPEEQPAIGAQQATPKKTKKSKKSKRTKKSKKTKKAAATPQ